MIWMEENGRVSWASGWGRKRKQIKIKRSAVGGGGQALKADLLLRDVPGALEQVIEKILQGSMGFLPQGPPNDTKTLSTPSDSLSTSVIH